MLYTAGRSPSIASQTRSIRVTHFASGFADSPEHKLNPAGWTLHGIRANHMLPGDATSTDKNAQSAFLKAAFLYTAGRKPRPPGITLVLVTALVDTNARPGLPPTLEDSGLSQ